MQFGNIRLFHKAKDGGPESKVDGYWLIEAKGWFSIALLRFGEGSRDAYHSHAFDAVSWLLTGGLDEHVKGEECSRLYGPGSAHQDSAGACPQGLGICSNNWVLTFRGPWLPTWTETVAGKETVLTQGRVVVRNALTLLPAEATP